jgi:hypothetical protein
MFVLSDELTSFNFPLICAGGGRGKKHQELDSFAFNPMYRNFLS